MKKLKDFLVPKTFQEVITGAEDYYGEAQLNDQPEMLTLCREKISREMRSWLGKNTNLTSYREEENVCIFECKVGILTLVFEGSTVTLTKDGKKIDQSKIYGAQYLLEEKKIGSIEVDLATMKRLILNLKVGE